MNIILLASSFSGLTQRVLRELYLTGHNVLEHYDLQEDLLRQQVVQFKPDVIICPFLTQRIPEDIWSKHLCLVVHPGIEGDRGASSLDWAISESWSYWGVTLLEAVEEMDAGDIWGTSEFPLRAASKTSIYKREVSSAAVKLIHEALADLNEGTFRPRPLDYDNPLVKGQLRDFCRQANRAINWQTDSTHAIAQKLRAADTTPGVLTEINGREMYAFGGVPDTDHHGQPGEMLGFYKGSILLATVDGAIWLRQLKCKTCKTLPPIKLPATMVMADIFPDLALTHIKPPQRDSICPVEDIRVERTGDVTYLYFNFYNGAFNTQQCVELKNVLREIKSTDTKVIVFMGGEDFWGNGIHLNCIEAAADPAQESWQNINAIDDLVLEMIDCPKQLTVAALRNNAGAGGAIMALACDKVIIRDGVTLNPHYKNMGLFGSEYWTYLLPKRVGAETAQTIVNECLPMLAAEAIAINYADELFTEDWQRFHQDLELYCGALSLSRDYKRQLKLKAKVRKADEKRRPLAQYRQHELTAMRGIFFNPDSEYHAARHAFVKKLKRDSVDEVGLIELAYGT